MSFDRTSALRAAVLAANACLVAGVGALGVWVFVRGPFVDEAQPPERFSPVAYALDTDARERSKLDDVWQQLDRPLPPKPKPQPGPTVLVVPRVEVVLVSIDEDHPERSVGIVETETGAQEVVQVGETLGGQVVKRIRVVDDGAIRRASIEFEDGAQVGFDRRLDD